MKMYIVGKGSSEVRGPGFCVGNCMRLLVWINSLVRNRTVWRVVEGTRWRLCIKCNNKIVIIYRLIHDVLPVLWERVPVVIWNRECKLQNWIWLIDKSLQVIENPRLPEKFNNTVHFHRKHTRCTICSFMTVYSIYCKRHSASQIIVLQKIFKRVPSYLHKFSCTCESCASHSSTTAMNDSRCIAKQALIRVTFAREIWKLHSHQHV